MIALYEDVGSEFSRTMTGLGAVAAMELLVTNGDLVMTWGFGEDADEFWAAFGAPEDPSDALGVPAGTEIGEFNMGMSLIFGLFDVSVKQVDAGCAVRHGGCAGVGFI